MKRRARSILWMALVVGVGGCSSTPDPIEPEAALGPQGDPSAYKFLVDEATGKPIRLNPCQVVPYVVNLDGAPPNALADVKAGFAMVSQATGIEFRHEGITDETVPPAPADGSPRPERLPFQPERYGPDRWAPILIAWVPLGETAAFTGDGTQAQVSPARRGGQVVSATIMLNSDSRQKARWVKRAIMHEMAHTLGLDHVADRYSIVSEDDYTSGRDNPQWSAGDVEGLRRLGREGGCLTPPQPGPDR